MRETNRQPQTQPPSKLKLYINDHCATVNALAATLGLRDAETKGHSERVVRFSCVLGRELGLDHSQMRSLEYGALLHDIGKIGVPDVILRKPGSLTTQEWARMREHPLLGWRILTGVGFLESASLIVLQHHERWDGRGYPYGLKGTDIDRNARIFAVADAFDAMTSDRVYRAGRAVADATEELKRRAGQQFDPEVVECFTRIPQREWELARQSRLLRAMNLSEYRLSH
jgi:HD-GYP domain-containing protein (c-di-GMP phosphodiesterase class II)